MRQSVKTQDKSAEARHHRIAKKTSVILNLLSALQGAPIPSAFSSFHNSAMSVMAHLKPHHAAGAVLRALQKSKGKCHRLSTPRRTATRGCKTELFPSGSAGWRLGRSGFGM